MQAVVSSTGVLVGGAQMSSTQRPPLLNGDEDGDEDGDG